MYFMFYFWYANFIFTKSFFSNVVQNYRVQNLNFRAVRELCTITVPGFLSGRSLSSKLKRTLKGKAEYKSRRKCTKFWRDCKMELRNGPGLWFRLMFFSLKRPVWVQKSGSEEFPDQGLTSPNLNGGPDFQAIIYSVIRVTSNWKPFLTSFTRLILNLLYETKILKTDGLSVIAYE